MTTEIHPESPTNSLPETGREIARRAVDASREAAKGAASAALALTNQVEGIAGDVGDATRGVAGRLADSAKDVYRSAARETGDAVVRSREFVGRNPVSVVFGAVAFGAAVGLVLLLARRKPTFRERYVEDPLLAMREAIASALSPLTQRVHDRYDSALEGAGIAMEQVRRLRPGNSGCSFSDRIRRVGNNLRFW